MDFNNGVKPSHFSQKGFLMSHLLPPVGHKARDMFDIQTLVDISSGALPIHTNIHELRRLAREAFAKTPAAKRFVYFRLDGSTDKLELISIGSRGGWRREWVFGPITRETRVV